MKAGVISALVFAAFPTLQVWAAPCCSSNAAAPALISSDDRAQLGISVSQGKVIGDAPENGLAIFRSSDDDEITRVWRLDGALLISDRFQAGATIPVLERSLQRPDLSDSATSVGDMRVSAAYEALPEWTWSPWKPRGFAFIEWTIPTGRSIYSSNAPTAVDVTGRGFHTLSTGWLLTKRWGNWDLYTLPEIHLHAARTFSSEGASGEKSGTNVGRGWGTSIAWGGGFSPRGGRLRMGARIQPLYNSSRTTQGSAGTSRTSPQRACDFTLDGSYLISSSWTLFSAYTDQTLIGPAQGTTLSRAVSIGLQHRWER